MVFGEFAYAYADYLDELGVHRPDMVGPNFDAGKRKGRREVKKFHKELVRKQHHMAAGRYRFLRWRKATVGLPNLIERYVRWFLVRILRVKSLSGRRQEISRDRLADFR